MKLFYEFDIVTPPLNFKISELNMPIKKAAFKTQRQAARKIARNAKVKANVDVLLRQSRKLLASKKIKESESMIKKTISALDKAAQYGIMKKNTVSRLKSRLMIRWNRATKL